MNLIDRKEINAIFIGHSLMNTQEFLVPEFLSQYGYKINSKACYGPGQTFEGHIENDKGIMTESQKDGIELGRIGGWFNDEKCDLLYEMAEKKKGYISDVLDEMPYDVAFIVAGLVDLYDNKKNADYFRQIIEKLRNNNADMKIIIVSRHCPLIKKPDMLPTFDWSEKSFALEFGCDIAPVGQVIRSLELQFPDEYFPRSQKDLIHLNTKGVLALTYAYIVAMFDNKIEKLPEQVSELTKVSEDTNKTETFSLDENFGKAFFKTARNETAKIIEEMKMLALDSLEKPIIKEDKENIDLDSSDFKILVIGNAYFDNDGALWRELNNSFKVRDKKTIVIETVTDDAATFESILANNKGEFTKRQKRIIDQISQSSASMGKGYDMDALDGMGDFQMKAALDFYMSRKGELDKKLAMDIKWDAIVLQGFRGALENEEHNFFESGTELIEKIKSACPDSPLHLMQHWKYKDDGQKEQEIINESYNKLAAKCDLPIIKVGEAWSTFEAKGVDMYATKYSPNKIGIQLVSEEIRKIII